MRCEIFLAVALCWLAGCEGSMPSVVQLSVRSSGPRPSTLSVKTEVMIRKRAMGNGA